MQNRDRQLSGEPSAKGSACGLRGLRRGSFTEELGRKKNIGSGVVKMRVQIPAPPLATSMNFNKLGELSTPQTPRLSNGDSDKYDAGPF